MVGKAFVLAVVFLLPCQTFSQLREALTEEQNYAFSYGLFKDGLTLGATLQVVGRRYLDLQATRSLEPFAALDLRADYAVVRPLILTVTVNNSFNQAQTSWDRYVGVGRTVAFLVSYT